MDTPSGSVVAAKCVFVHLQHVCQHLYFTIIHVKDMSHLHCSISLPLRSAVTQLVLLLLVTANNSSPQSLTQQRTFVRLPMHMHKKSQGCFDRKAAPAVQPLTVCTLGIPVTYCTGNTASSHTLY